MRLDKATRQYIDAAVKEGIQDKMRQILAMVGNGNGSGDSGILVFDTYQLMQTGLATRTAPARVIVLADEENGGGEPGRYDYTGSILIEDLL